MKSKWHLGLSLCALGTCGWVVAQDPPREERREQAPPPVERREGVRVEGEVRTERSASTDRMTYYRVKQVLGTKVSIEGDISIGVVEDIVFADDGRIEYMVVANDGKFVSVPWDAAKFNFERRSAMVAISQERFREIPTFTAESYPTFHDPKWRTTTYSYYNIPPRGDLNRRQERKIDRTERKIDRKVDKAERKGDRP